MKTFFRFFAERHKLASLITIMTILLGLNTLMKIKRDIYPQVDFGMMSIMTRYPGASPDSMQLDLFAGHHIGFGGTIFPGRGGPWKATDLC